jgi:hypothetical protein
MDIYIGAVEPPFNEKRGGLKVVSFDGFALSFSRNSVQTPSCERPKTT